VNASLGGDIELKKSACYGSCMSEHDVFWKLSALSDEQVLDGLRHTVASGWRLSARLVAHLGEVEERRLHLDAACSSMFNYCVTQLGLSEDEACRRIDVARLGASVSRDLPSPSSR
jgi:hypothetical protein